MRAQLRTCPFLVPVMADRLWLLPVPAYCRRPDAPMRVPATSSLLHRCTDDYTDCEGYRAASARMEGFTD
jgi:hypothetical protein